MENVKYLGKYYKLIEEEINGQIYEKAYFKHAIIAYPLLDNKKFLFIKELRVHENPKLRIKPVTGFLEDDLTWEENTQKELREEVGLCSNNIELFHHYKSSGGFNSAKYFSICSDLYVDDNPIINPDGDVILEKIEYTIEEALEKSLSGEIKITADTLGLFLLYHNKELREKYGY